MRDLDHNIYLFFLDADGNSNTEEANSGVKKPRYVRVNTLKMDLESALSYLNDEGWVKEETEDYLSLNDYSFAIDNFVDNLLVFPIGTELFKHPLYLNGTFVLQDKVCRICDHVTILY